MIESLGKKPIVLLEKYKQISYQTDTNLSVCRVYYVLGKYGLDNFNGYIILKGTRYPAKFMQHLKFYLKVLRIS